MTPETQSSRLTANDLMAALNYAEQNALPTYIHREIISAMDNQVPLLFVSPLDRANLSTPSWLSQYPQALCDLTPFIQSLSETEIDQAVSHFSLTSGHLESPQSLRHELRHYQTALDLGFPNPRILVYFFHDQDNFTYPHWFVDDGPVPDNLTDDEIRLAIYQICLAPEDPSESDVKTARAIRSYYWRTDRKIHRQLRDLNAI